MYVIRLYKANVFLQKRFNPATDVKIKQFIQHPFWDSPKHYYDIALVELTEAVSFSNLVRPACLPGSFPSKYDAYITGWGVTDGKVIFLTRLVKKILLSDVISHVAICETARITANLY